MSYMKLQWKSMKREKTSLSLFVSVPNVFVKCLILIQWLTLPHWFARTRLFWQKGVWIICHFWYELPWIGLQEWKKQRSSQKKNATNMDAWTMQVIWCKRWQLVIPKWCLWWFGSRNIKNKASSTRILCLCKTVWEDILDNDTNWDSDGIFHAKQQWNKYKGYEDDVIKIKSNGSGDDGNFQGDFSKWQCSGSQQYRRSWLGMWKFRRRGWLRCK